MLKYKRFTCNFVELVNKSVMDVLTPEQRMQIANATDNPGLLAPPTPIAFPMQAPGIYKVS